MLTNCIIPKLKFNNQSVDADVISHFLFYIASLQKEKVTKRRSQYVNSTYMTLQRRWSRDGSCKAEMMTNEHTPEHSAAGSTQPNTVRPKADNRSSAECNWDLKLDSTRKITEKILMNKDLTGPNLRLLTCYPSDVQHWLNYYAKAPKTRFSKSTLVAWSG